MNTLNTLTLRHYLICIQFNVEIYFQFNVEICIQSDIEIYSIGGQNQ